MKSRVRIILPILLILAIVGFLFWLLFGHQETAKPNTITGNGVIEATEVDLSSKVAGKVVSLQAHEGDDVHAGQLVALLDSGELTGGVEQSQGNLKAVEAAYAALRAGSRPEDIRRVRAQYEAAQSAQRQAEAQLSLIKAGAREELINQLRAVYHQAQAQLSLVKAGPRKEDIEQLRAVVNQTEAQLSLVKEGPRKEDIAQLQAALDQAKATLNDAETELKRVQKMNAQGAVSGQMVDQATTRRDVAQAAVDAAQQRLAAAKSGARPQEIQAAEDAVTAARQRLDAAVNGARPQEIQAAEATVEAARQRLEEAKHGPRPQEREQAEALVAAARDQVAAAKAALDLVIAGPRKEDIAAARARVEQAQGTLNTSQSSQSQTHIYAPSDGRVILRNVEPGELVTPGLPIIRIAEIRNVWIRVYVPEEQIKQIKVGQRADVTTDASGSKHFSGRVTEIAQQPEFTPKNVQTKEERVKLVFGIKIEVDNPQNELKPGMPGDAVIYTKD